MQLRGEGFPSFVQLSPGVASIAPLIATVMREYPNETSDQYSTWSLSKGVAGKQSYYEWAGIQPPELTARFGRAMHTYSIAAFPVLTQVYPWSTLGSGTLIDVGGGRGHISQLIAGVAPDLKFIVQDVLYEVEDQIQQTPEELRDRIVYEKYDYWTEQTQEAEAYLLRHVLHNHSDARCVNILRNILPGLKPGSNGSGGRILICDKVLIPGATKPPLLAEALRMVCDHMSTKYSMNMPKLVTLILVLSKEHGHVGNDECFRTNNRRA